MVSYEENLRVPGSFQPLNGHEEGLGLMFLDNVSWLAVITGLCPGGIRQKRPGCESQAQQTKQGSRLSAA
jgi:hypothetical protein